MNKKRYTSLFLAVMMSFVLAVCMPYMSAQAAGTVTVANADAIFGEALDLGDTELQGFIKGKAYGYVNGNRNLVDTYVDQMKELGFKDESFEMEVESSSVVICKLSQGDAMVMLFFEVASSQVCICYQEGMEYEQQAAIATQKTGLQLPIFSTIAPQATQEPDSADEAAAGYLTVELDGEEMTFIQTSAEDKYGNYIIYFYLFNVRGKKQSSISIWLDYNVTPGEVYSTTRSIKEFDFDVSVHYDDSPNDFWTADYDAGLGAAIGKAIPCASPSGSDFEIAIDSVSDDGYSLTGRLNAILVRENNIKEKVKLTNGRFQIRLPVGAEDWYYSPD